MKLRVNCSSLKQVSMNYISHRTFISCTHTHRQQQQQATKTAYQNNAFTFKVLVLQWTSHYQSPGRREVQKEEALNNLASKDKKGPSSIRWTLELFQRQHWETSDGMECTERIRKGHRQSDKNWNSFKGNIRKLLMGWSAYMSFFKHTDSTLIWTFTRGSTRGWSRPPQEWDCPSFNPFKMRSKHTKG